MRNKKLSINWVYAAVMCVCILFNYNYTKASHLYGADFFYTHVSGNTYTITLHAYGDCGGTQFPSLSSSFAEIEIYNGNTRVRIDTLILQNPTAGIEVTPVCPAQANNTRCKSTTSTIPGIKKFVYSKNITLSTTSGSWRFLFNGTMINSFAGRSSSITNVTNAGTTVMQLEATLNNLVSPNSSPTLTTVPTPFFCINKSTGYNPGAVDPNSDSLVYGLVPGLISGGTVSYATGYSATAPLAASTGTFNTSSSTGQINFTPNLVQQSLVVQKVSEYRNGILVGTSMREMTFIVFSTCINNSPAGKIANNNMGKVDNAGTTIKVCKAAGVLTFNINPSDADNDTITATISGLPAGASLNFSSNTTKTPTSTFSWDISTRPIGTYTFYVTYRDNGCPLASNQTTAYTVNIQDLPSSSSVVTNALCNGDASGAITITGKGINSPFTYAIGSGTYSTASTFSTLLAGIHRLYVKDSLGCIKDTSITVGQPTALKFTNIVSEKTTCYKTSTGAISVSGVSGGTTPYTYAIGSGTFGTTNRFTSLAAGVHTIHLKDKNGCTLDSNVTVSEAAEVNVDKILITPTTCFNTATGRAVVVASGGTSPYTYSVGAGSFSSNDTFTNLSATQYKFTVRDNNNCTKDSTVTIPNATKIIPQAAVKQNTCQPLSTGGVTLNATGGTPTYTYAVGTGTYSAQPSFSSLAAATHTFHIRDKNNCIVDTNIVIGDSLILNAGSTVTNAHCKDSNSGIITITLNNGVAPYTYSIGTSTYTSSNTFSKLGAGTYSFRVKDNLGCTTSVSATITEPTLIIPQFNFIPPACKGNNNGSITVTATGGTPNYEYAFNNGVFSTLGSMSSLATGIYPISVRDSRGCRIDTNVRLTEPETIRMSVTLQNPLCNSDNSGQVRVTGSGGTTPYMYAANQAAFTASSVLTGLSAGTHIINIRDQNNCRADTTITLTEPSKLFIDSIAIIHPTCEGFTDGMVTVFASGGVNPYTFKANSGQFSPDNSIANLAEGAQTITVRDANNCLTDSLFSLTGLPHIKFHAEVENVKCFGGNDGVIIITAAGGVEPFKYQLSNGPSGSTPTFENLAAGRYSFTITDSAGCKKDSSATITMPDKIQVSVTATNNDCNGPDDGGTLQANVAGGTPGYNYIWAHNTERNESSLGGLANGSYKVIVKDANGCMDSATSSVLYENCCNIFIPDAFTPNRDGLNDVVRVLVKGDFKLEIFAIYNRFGERVFYTSDMAQGWNGLYKATDQDMGTYNYFVKGICGNGGTKEVFHKGTIMLIR